MTRQLPSRICAILFDLDGVLVDTMPSHFASWRAIAAELGIPLSSTELQAFRGVRRELCLNRILERVGTVDAVTYADLLARKNALYCEALARIATGIVMPGTYAVLEGLRRAGVPIGLVSASRNAQTILALAGLTDLFDAQSDGHFEGLPKPAPDQIRAVAARLGVAPEETAVFEDAPAGLLAAEGAGAMGVGIGALVWKHPAAAVSYQDLSVALSGPPLAELLD